MSDSTSDIPKNLKIGSTLTFLAGLIPFTVALILFVLYWISVFNPENPWLSGQLPPKPASYSLDSIEAFNEQLATDFVVAQHIEFANVINTGFVVLILSIFGLRGFQKWSWYAILIIFLWVGLNDALALFQGDMPLIPLLPEIIGLIGLFIARPAIFNGESGT